MFTRNHTNPPLRGPRRPPFSLQLVIFSVGLILFAWTPTQAQMGNSVIYSDSWFDSSTNPMYVVGVGITSDSYNTYGHRYWVNTTVTSPTGRYASGSSSTSSSYARVDVYLDWNFEFGDFTVNTTHSMTCPYIYGVVTAPTIFDIKLTRSSYLGTGWDGAYCTYELGCAPGTDATCKLYNVRALPIGTSCVEAIGKYFWCIDISYNGQCVKYATVCVGPYNLPQWCN